MKYVCAICGYVYDEEKEGVPFSELAESWTCPGCGAEKAMFDPVQETAEKETVSAAAADDGLRALSPRAMSMVFSNLARGCQKQYRPEEEALFRKLSDYYLSHSSEGAAEDEKELAALVSAHLKTFFPQAEKAASENGDRGALRARLWANKTELMIQSLLSRYEKEGEAWLENSRIWVCSVCGFIFIGDRLPAVCPVCKVPDWKFELVD